MLLGIGTRFEIHPCPYPLPVSFHPFLPLLLPLSVPPCLVGHACFFPPPCFGCVPVGPYFRSFSRRSRPFRCCASVRRYCCFVCNFSVCRFLLCVRFWLCFVGVSGSVRVSVGPWPCSCFRGSLVRLGSYFRRNFGSGRFFPPSVFLFRRCRRRYLVLACLLWLCMLWSAVLSVFISIGIWFRRHPSRFGVPTSVTWFCRRFCLICGSVGTYSPSESGQRSSWISQRIYIYIYVIYYTPPSVIWSCRRFGLISASG